MDKNISSLNSSHLRHNVFGSIQAWLITDQGESVADDDMNATAGETGLMSGAVTPQEETGNALPNSHHKLTGTPRIFSL